MSKRPPSINDPQGHADRMVRRENHMQWLYENKEFTDCTLVVGPGKSIIEAHKTILIQSPYFRSAFKTGRFREGEENTVAMPEEDADDIKRLIEYIYTGNYSLPEEFNDLRLLRGSLVPGGPIYIHLAMYILADRHVWVELKEHAFHRMSCSLAAGCFWREGLVGWITEVYETAPEGAKDLRLLAMTWALWFAQEAGGDEAHIEEMLNLLNIPEFGEELRNSLANQYLKHHNWDPVCGGVDVHLPYK